MANYILAMGGYSHGDIYDTVDVFKVTSNGVEKVTGHGLSLSVARQSLSSASCGGYTLAMGGYSSPNYSDTVDVFKATASGVEQVTGHGLALSVARSGLSAASCGNYILAMGGTTSNYSDTVDVFRVTSSGVEQVTGHGLALSVARSHLSAASCGNYILAMGGYADNSYSDTVDVFRVTANGVEQVTGHGLSLSVGRTNLSSASCGEYILAMGGDAGSPTNYDTVDVFKVTSNGVEKVTDHGLSLSVARTSLAAASCGEYILSLGGIGNNTYYCDTVDVFKVTSSGVEKVTDHWLSLSVARFNLAAASCGDYVLSMGGRSREAAGAVDTVDVFKRVVAQ